ncbi:class I SAM-dependent methyltransferase [Microbacterium sp. ISL-108]|nr:class I SAM-dependent methyltransferase [Microbacterium sp. ISL-108]RKN68487.1 class I SAM-dependent methyltransferase [Microbacterium sp. CGR2]
MLDVLRAKFPRVEPLIGTAEKIPVVDASMDTVTVAQAFHWSFPDSASCVEKRCAGSRRSLAPTIGADG